jgi:hypothetical protein
VKFALTASINLARHIGLMAFKYALSDENLTDLEVQTCPVELSVGRISCFSRDVNLKGFCRGKEFNIRIGLIQSKDGIWSVGGVHGTYDDWEFGWNHLFLASLLKLNFEDLAVTG